MPEALFCLILASVFAAVKREQIRFIYTHFKRTFTDLQRTSFRVDPYRDNPEVERDCARRRAEEAEAANAKLQSEIEEIRMERDLAERETDLRVFKGRARLGSAFALGALTCFTSVNIAPQQAHDLLMERPVTVARTAPVGHSLLTMAQRYYPYRECAVRACCHHTRPRLVEIDHLVLRLDENPIPVQYFWFRIRGIDIDLATSGGEEVPSTPGDQHSEWIECYALPATRDNLGWLVPPTAITISFD